MQTIQKSTRFDFKPPEEKKFNFLQKLNRRILTLTKQLIVSLLPNHPSANKPNQVHKGAPAKPEEVQTAENDPIYYMDPLYEHKARS